MTVCVLAANLPKYQRTMTLGSALDPCSGRSRHRANLVHTAPRLPNPAFGHLPPKGVGDDLVGFWADYEAMSGQGCDQIGNGHRPPSSYQFGHEEVPQMPGRHQLGPEHNRGGATIETFGWVQPFVESTVFPSRLDVLAPDLLALLPAMIQVSRCAASGASSFSPGNRSGPAPKLD